MGTVFLGRSAAGRPVAIKIVRSEFWQDAEFRGRFRSEVNRAQQVPPFSTAEVLDADPDHDPPYLVVEYVDGPSLSEVVRNRGPLAGSSLQSVAVGMATALTAIHGAKVIHRDLKPGNVLFAMGGVKVIDFGIAKPMEATSHHTATDQMVGTIEYMAPERFAPEASTVVGQPADIFAWGAVVAYAATGRTPFAADSAPATAMRILTQPPELGGLSGRLRDLVGRALAKDPGERPTARELLDHLLDGHQQQTPARSGPLPPAWQPPGDDPTVISPVWPPPPDDMAGATVTSGPPAWRPPGTDSGARPAFGTGPPRRRRRWPVVLAIVLLALLLLPLILHKLNGGDSEASVINDPAGSSGATPSVSVSSVKPSAAAAADPTGTILAGKRRTLVHLAEADRDLAMPATGDAAPSDGTRADALFRLEPLNGDSSYLIHGVPYAGDAERCLGVRTVTDEVNALAATDCYTYSQMIFRIVASGHVDDKGRPTYVISNDRYGTVQFSATRRVLFVAPAKNGAPETTFSFVDRGAA